MILAKLGVLSRAQQCATNTSTDSTNVIQLNAIDWGAITNVWWVVDTYSVATGDGSDTYQFQLVLSQEDTLDTNIQVLSRIITGNTAWCLAGAGRHIVCCNIGKMLNEILGTGLSDYYFLGGIATLSDGAGIYINQAVSPTEPDTVSHSQAVVSNVGVPAHCSAGS